MPISSSNISTTTASRYDRGTRTYDRTAFVSPDAGNNETAVIGNTNQAFATIEAAEVKLNSLTPAPSVDNPVEIVVFGGILVEDITLNTPGLTLQGANYGGLLKDETTPGNVIYTPLIPGDPGTTAAGGSNWIDETAASPGDIITIGGESWTGVNGAPANGFEFDASAGGQTAVENFFTQFNANNTNNLEAYWCDFFGDFRTEVAFVAFNGIGVQSLGPDHSTQNGITVNFGDWEVDTPVSLSGGIDGTADTPAIYDIVNSQSTFIDGEITIDENNITVKGIDCTTIILANGATHSNHDGCIFSHITASESITVSHTQEQSKWYNVHSYSFIAGSSCNGYYSDCTGNDNSFGGTTGIEISGTFIRCVGNNNCFGASISNALFEDCKGNEYCFGIAEVGSRIVDSNFYNCQAQDYGFIAVEGHGVLFENCSITDVFPETSETFGFFSNSLGLETFVYDITLRGCRVEYGSAFKVTGSAELRLAVFSDGDGDVSFQNTYIARDCIVADDIVAGSQKKVEFINCIVNAIADETFSGLNVECNNLRLVNSEFKLSFTGRNVIIGNPPGYSGSSGTVDIYKCKFSNSFASVSGGTVRAQSITITECDFGTLFDIGKNTYTTTGTYYDDITISGSKVGSLFQAHGNIASGECIIGQPDFLGDVSIEVVNTSINGNLFSDLVGASSPTIPVVVGDETVASIAKGNYCVQFINCKIATFHQNTGYWNLKNTLLKNCVISGDVCEYSATTGNRTSTIDNVRFDNVHSTNPQNVWFETDISGATHDVTMTDIALIDVRSACSDSFNSKPIVGYVKGLIFKPVNNNQHALIIAGGTQVDNCTLVGTGTGDSIYSASAINAKIYNCSLNKTPNANITNDITTPYNVEDANIDI